MSDPRADDLGELAATYDDWYGTPGAAHWEEAPGKAVLVAAARRCRDARRPLRVLDVGCGTGSFLERLRREVSPLWRCRGVDLSAVAVARGAERYPELRLAAGDGAALDFPDGHFDLVTCYGSWEHFPEPEKAIAEAARVTAPGGWVLAMIPALGIHRVDRDDEGWYEDTEVEGSDRRQWQWNLRRSTWAAMFGNAGLQLAADSLAAACGARKPGVFFFATRLYDGGVAEAGPAARSLLALAHLATEMARELAPRVEEASELLIRRLAAGGKVLACGNGGSAADAQHFVAELVGRMARERRALPAVALSSDPSVVTALANDYGYDRLFARQVEGLGRAGDVLLAISTSGRSPNVLEAVRAARRRGLATVALLGEGGDAALEECDVTLRVPCADTQRVQEAHGAILHALCGAVEEAVVKEGSGDRMEEAKP